MSLHISFPVRKGIKGFFATATREESIIENIRAIILTGPGERVMRGDIGIPLVTTLWDPADEITLSALTTFIRSQIARHEPRVVVQGVTPQLNILQNNTAQILIQVDIVILPERVFRSVSAGVVVENRGNI